MQDPLFFAFSIAILIFSVIAHELAHGYAADSLGDPTPRLAGRLSINPLVHIDLFGSILLPTASFLLGGVIFGWAKPVPYNPYNLKSRAGEAFVASAGILTNLALALFFGLLLRFFGDALSAPTVALATSVVFINCILAIFNSIPLPPLDGSKVLFSFLPFHLLEKTRALEAWGLPALLFVVFFLWPFLSPLVTSLSRLIIGA
ncbi:site-2 protease family protein [Candidatus Parcubacteria bacterium]|nr:site-2 protease family protein [Candidatus Parcubacteria bacterium]